MHSVWFAFKVRNLIFELQEIQQFRSLAREISSLPTVAHFDMVQLDCDDLKRGLAAKANRFADQLLQRLAEEHRDENKRWHFFPHVMEFHNNCLCIWYDFVLKLCAIFCHLLFITDGSKLISISESYPSYAATSMQVDCRNNVCYTGSCCLIQVSAKIHQCTNIRKSCVWY